MNHLKKMVGKVLNAIRLFWVGMICGAAEGTLDDHHNSVKARRLLRLAESYSRCAYTKTGILTVKIKIAVSEGKVEEAERDYKELCEILKSAPEYETFREFKKAISEVRSLMAP